MQKVWPFFITFLQKTKKETVHFVGEQIPVLFCYRQLFSNYYIVLSLFKQRPRVAPEWTQKQVPKFGREKHQDRALLLLYRLILSGQIRKFC